MVSMKPYFMLTMSFNLEPIHYCNSQLQAKVKRTKQMTVLPILYFLLHFLGEYFLYESDQPVSPKLLSLVKKKPATVNKQF